MYIPPVSLTDDITRPVVANRHQSSSFSPSDSMVVPFGTRTAHDPSSSIFSVDDILQIILKTRKSWKTLKGQSEAVWPPYLEATMLKALQEYEPDDSRETRMLGRYPMRNRFISDYIHRTTGKYRSAKQVGSRLQQLRDTPEGRDLIDVLTRCCHTRMDDTCDARVPIRQPRSFDDSSYSPSVSVISCDSSSTSSSDFPVTPTNSIMPQLPQLKPRQPIESRAPVYIDILPQQSHWSSPGHTPSPASSAPSSGSDSHPSDPPRHIRHIDPSVTFVSPSPVNGKSSYIVLFDGAPVHTEDTKLEYVGPYYASPAGQNPGDQPMLYNTTLVPKYWDVLCEAADPTLYSIIQDVYHVPRHVPNQNYSQRPRPVRIFSAIYHFKYPSADTGSTPSYGQSTVPSSTSPSVTSLETFSDQTLQGTTYATSYPVPSMHSPPTSDGSRALAQVDQNLFDEPFILDVNFDQVAFDDFVNVDTGSEGTGSTSSQFYSSDPNRFYM